LGKWSKRKEYQRLKIENELLQGENHYLRKQYEELKGVQDRFRIMRHEMKNEYAVELEYLKRKQYDELERHYLRKADAYPGKRRFTDTGNMGLDAALGSRLKRADQEKIRIELDNRIRGRIAVEDWDMSMLLGNLIDNSMEAVRELEAKDRWIRIRISTDGTAFFLEVSNPYGESRKKDGRGNYLTGKQDKLLHGLGLFQVKRIARKYGGRAAFSDEAEVFCTKVLLYMNRQ